MKRREVLRQLRAHLPALKRRFGVKSLVLFGSTARDTAGPDSDLDILVVFDGPATTSRYFGLQFYLEDLFGVPVNLITDKALRPELKPFVERDAIYV